MSVPRETLAVSAFFDLKGLWFSDVFENAAWAWSPLAPDYRKTWLEKTIQPNVFHVKRLPSGLLLEDAVLETPGFAPITISAGAVLSGNDIQLFPGVQIEATAFVSGPTILGPNTVVRHGAYIRGGVVTGDSTVIGHATEVKNSYLLNGAKAAHFAYVGDSIVGANANLGAGTKLSNLRMDHKHIFANLGGQKIETGLRKFGGIVGDGAEIGCNAVINPGTLLGPKSAVYPCVSVKPLYYGPGSVVR